MILEHFLYVLVFVHISNLVNSICFDKGVIGVNSSYGMMNQQINSL